MEDLKKEYTIVIVTHNMQQASRISDYTGFFYIEEMGGAGPALGVRFYGEDVLQSGAHRD